MEIKVHLRPLSAVRPHEETAPELTAKLSRAILSDAVQRDPIIVDRNTGTVLDGTHRLSSLKEIGARNVVCHLVEYTSAAVKLQRWLRVLRMTREGVLPPLLESLGIHHVVSRREAFDIVERRGKSIAILTYDKCYVPVHSLRSVADCYDLLKGIDLASKELGWKRDFVDEEYVNVELRSPKNVIVLAPWLSKLNVLRAASTGRLLPYKTTMHVVDLRPLGVNYPLAELKKHRPSKDMLIEKLTTPKISIMNPPYTHLGRTYKERVVVLERK